MSASYLQWLTDVFELGQIPHDAAALPTLDAAMRHITDTGADTSDEEVYRVIRERWLRKGPSGRQLLISLIRNQIFARRDSSLRPAEGLGYYTNP